MAQPGFDTSPQLICAVFAYGTLKRGQCRERCWPHPPLGIQTGYVFGRLHDLGAYPALVEGTDRIAGELWHLAPEHLAETLRVLDEVEGATEERDPWFIRRVATCYMFGGGEAQAWIYYFARPERIADCPTVAADADGLCRWPRAHA